jgi:hypothetical protein
LRLGDFVDVLRGSDSSATVEMIVPVPSVVVAGGTHSLQRYHD